ncbi:MAG: glycosyltransferase family 4 protein [Anaerolineaceae bacterium]|nr:glycosyltransferase family 4 protein [Anaerolineaceae bacterium]
MNILLVADGRSPITRRWIEELQISGHQVGLVASFPCNRPAELDYFKVLPICFSKYAGSQVGKGSGEKGDQQKSQPKMSLKSILKRYRKLFQKLRYWIGPPTLWHYQPLLKRIIHEQQPDIVHALRIPFEGMLGLACPKDVPFIVSIWGNDLTLHAPKNFWMRHLTERVLKRANGLITDVDRDIELAAEWGYDPKKPVMVALTSGGIDFGKLDSNMSEETDPLIAQLPTDAVLIVNPRGIRPGYVRNDTFFAAISKVVEESKQKVLFVCPSMANQPQAIAWVEEFGIHESVKLLPYLSQKQLWQLFAKTTLMISVTEHDGTPNSLLESMSLGAFPIVGDIQSLREWIVDGENGSLVDPGDSEALAETILRALADEALLGRSKKANYQKVMERASCKVIREQRDQFYSKIRKELAL